MKTVWSVVKKLQTNERLIKKYKDRSYEINAEAKDIIDAMSDEEVQVTLKKLHPDYTCSETSGPHDDYYLVRSDWMGNILGSGDTEKQALRSGLSEAIWELREKFKCSENF
jgi:hypothetical protein